MSVDTIVTAGVLFTVVTTASSVGHVTREGWDPADVMMFGVAILFWPVVATVVAITLPVWAPFLITRWLLASAKAEA